MWEEMGDGREGFRDLSCYCNETILQNVEETMYVFNACVDGETEGRINGRGWRSLLEKVFCPSYIYDVA